MPGRRLAAAAAAAHRRRSSPPADHPAALHALPQAQIVASVLQVQTHMSTTHIDSTYNPRSSRMGKQQPGEM